MQYSSLIGFTFAKTLVMGLNVLKNKMEISVLYKAHFNVIALSNRWNHLKGHLCLDCKGWSISLGTAELLWPQVHPPWHPLHLVGRSWLRHKSCLLVWLVRSLVSQRGHRYRLSRTKAMHNCLISDGKKGWRLTLTTKDLAESGLECKSSQAGF